MNLELRAKEMKDFFNEKVDTYEDVHMKRINAKEKIVDFLPDELNNIIDLGTGTGLQFIKLYEKYPDVRTTAIDVSDEMLNKLREKNISDNINID